MLSRRRALVASFSLVSVAVLEPVRAASLVSGASARAATIAEMLPTERDVPEGLMRTLDVKRTLSEVMQGYSDPIVAARNFRSWGWKGNVVRDFAVPDGEPIPDHGVSFIHVSIHRFGSAATCKQAMTYSVNDQKKSTTAHEEGGVPLGDASRILFERTAAGSDLTLYFRRGSALVRLSALAPNGDPTEVAFSVAKAILAK